MRNKTLSERQREVMNVLWDTDKPMTAKAIQESTDLDINTIQASLRSLVTKNYIEIKDIVYSGTVLARAYTPIISREKYFQMICRAIKDTDVIRITANAAISQIADTETLDEIVRAIEQRKKELEDGREK